MRQLIEDNISQASTQQTAPFIVEVNGEDAAQAHAQASNDESLDSTLPRAKADPIPIPRPRPVCSGADRIGKPTYTTPVQARK
jgi:hypothetical protein